MMFINRLELLRAMHEGHWVITPNNRLSQQLHHDYFHQYATHCITKPRCHSYVHFLNHLFKGIRHQHPEKVHPLLLTSHQIKALWRQVINATRPTPCHEGLLNQVISAWSICQDWLISPQHESFSATAQTQQFQQWYATFTQTTQELNLITEGDVVNYIASHPCMFPSITMVWACFDAQTPRQVMLQATLESQGMQHVTHDFNQSSANADRIEAHDPMHEQQLLITWLKQQLNLNETRIGVVIPDLTAIAPSIHRLLLRHFSANEFNMSMGSPLTHQPLIAHALQWLNLQPQTLTSQQAKLMLYSPYLQGGYNELMPRSHFLQTNNLVHDSLIHVSRFKAAVKPQCPQLFTLLHNLQSYPESATPEVWFNQFHQRLNQLGFPGENTLVSSSYQGLKRFYSVLEEFRLLTRVMPMMSTTEALTELTALAEASLFQPQQAPNPRIHVLGLLEASGCTFDSLWVMGMTDECLPKATQLSAFIAHDLQRELNMPHANVTRELQWADTLLQRLQQSTLNCVFSHARLVDDNPCLPSPLIRHLPAKSISPPPEIEQHQLERYDEQETFALPLTQKTPGGTALLAHQAQCPFKAFAAHRLHAKIEHEISEGLNSLERGQLIHRCLELLWAHLKNQQTLLHYPPQKLNQRIEACIEEALAPFAMENRLSFPVLIQQIETQRLKQLIEACLNEERRREPFEVIAVEYATEVQLADLTFRIKLDRLDELPSGNRWVIDYKTQLPSRKPWHDERPEAPQLLMYGLLDADIHGLIFMEISQGHVIWAGLCDEPSNIKGMRCPPAHQSWAEQRDAWQQQLTQLANEFQRGHCAPTPKRLSLCTRCDFKPLCRVT